MPSFEESDFAITTKDPQNSDFCNQLKGVLIQGLDILVESENMPRYKSQISS